MSDMGDVAARLAELSDTDIAVVVQQATAARPGLASLHSAAVDVTADGVPVPEPTETLPAIAEPEFSTTPDVPPPVKLPAALGGDAPAYTAAGVPTLEGVADKIESRLNTALGETDLAAETPVARSTEKRWADREKAGQDKMEEIRASLRRTIRPER